MLLHVIFLGQVQGVGFRWKVCALAERYQLSGSVQNLDDGSVEVYAAGSKKKLEKFLQETQTLSGAVRIDSMRATFSEVTTEYEDFRILS